MWIDLKLKQWWNRKVSIASGCRAGDGLWAPFQLPGLQDLPDPSRRLLVGDTSVSPTLVLCAVDLKIRDFLAPWSFLCLRSSLGVILFFSTQQSTAYQLICLTSVFGTLPGPRGSGKHLTFLVCFFPLSWRNIGRKSWHMPQKSFETQFFPRLLFEKFELMSHTG